jgi:cold-inducible RNA-binding protein
MNIYVGNLPHATTDQELRQAFEAYGEVASASIIKDKFTGDSRGFGFVEMPNQSEAREAMQALNDQEFGGRTLTVNEAKPREERSGGGGYGGGGGNRGGGGGYGGGGGNRGGGGGNRGGGGGYGGGGNRGGYR